MTEIKSDTLQFLEQVSANNNREWFLEHKSQHDSARENVLQFVSEIIRGLSEIDSQISVDLNAKDCVMRIYRDIRFSKDKTPYKTNFGAYISPKGKNSSGPGYYLHISPSECFVAGGCWMPPADQLKSIRQEIDYNGADLRQILEDPEFKKYFKGLDSTEKLKTTPKGYPADHPEIELLKLKSFTLSHNIAAKELAGPDAVKKVLDAFVQLHPFIAFLRNALA